MKTAFRVDVADETLARIMKKLCAYWTEEFDWRKQEAAMFELVRAAVARPYISL